MRAPQRPAHRSTRSPVSFAAAFLAASEASLAGVGGLVDRAAWDLAQASFGTRGELEAYCERWSTALIWPWARCAVPGIAPAQLLPLGSAHQEHELLRTARADARAGRVRVPLDELERAGA